MTAILFSLICLFTDDVVAMAADEEILITDVAEYLQLGIAYLSGERCRKIIDL